MPDCMSLLFAGDIANAAVCPFINTMGIFFYGVIIFAILAGIYFKTQNVTMVAVIGIVTFSVFNNSGLMPPEGQQLGNWLLAVAIAVVLASIYKR